MENDADIPDPTDWLNTPVSHLSSVESALHCQICKDLFNTPMITSCSHTFCSLCIRRCLTDDGLCPACRTPDQMMKLRQNWAIQELVEAFQRARPSVLKLAKEVRKDVDEPARKRRRVEHTDESTASIGETPPQRRSLRHSGKSQPKEDSDEDYTDVEEQEQAADGLSACPICGQRMKAGAVFSHLDVHNEPHAFHKKTQASSSKSPYFQGNTGSNTVKSVERLPQINYSLLKDNALRKKLAELGIPNTGSRALLTRRHTEWINLVNANCDSRSPRPKRELLRDLEAWDRTQARQISSTHSSNLTITNKDFDGNLWAIDHDRDFKRLIAEARKKAQAKKTIPNDGHARLGGQELSPAAPAPSDGGLSVPDPPVPRQAESVDLSKIEDNDWIHESSQPAH